MNIDYFSVTLSMDEGNSYWQSTCVLANPNEHPSFPVGGTFTVRVQGEDFKFIVDQKSIQKPERTSGGQPDKVVTISGISPSVQLAAPRATPITKTWGETTALTIAQEVLKDYPYVWEILDWPLRKNLFAVSSQTPLDIVNTLAATVGAVVESLPNGTLRIRYRFPVPVTQYGHSTCDVNLSEADDAYSSTEGFRSSKTYNRIRVSSSNVTTQADRLEFAAGAFGFGRLLVYPSPWRDTFTIESTHTGTTISPALYNERTISEVIEIKASRGSVAYPIQAIVSSNYLTQNLGGVSFEQGSTEITTLAAGDGYSLLQVTYKVRAYAFDVSGPTNESSQFIMRNKNG